MSPYYDEAGIAIYHGNCREVLPTFTDGRFSTVITDPPYELGFMGRKWDSSGIAFQSEVWAEVLRVCKPGAMMLAFGGTRTYHRMACAIEDAGWELRDCIMWVFGSGFPKSLDISKAIDKDAGAPLKLPTTEAALLWSGYGTALKPAYEPIIVAMKPLDGTFANNAQKHGVAGLNIDGGRIAADGRPLRIYRTGTNRSEHNTYAGDRGSSMAEGTTSVGRWPTNIIFDEAAAEMLDQQSGTLESGKPAGVKAGGKLNCYGTYAGGIPVTGYGDSGGASRFFYTAKASRSDRGHGNDHPTVKPLALMRYLCRLTRMPGGGEILDPFGGSMTTLVAAREEGRAAVAIDMEQSHCEIGKSRLSQGVLFGAEGGAA